MARIIASFVSFTIITVAYKQISLHYRHSVWEDIYGRSIVFFFCSFIQYLYEKDDVSIFEIRPTIRFTLFLRVLFMTIAYFSYVLAIKYSNSFVYISLIICLLPLMTKFVQRNAMLESKLTLIDIICILASIVGLFFLYRPNSNYNPIIAKENYNNMLAYIFGVICIASWSVATYLLHKSQVYVHYTIDNLLVSLFSTMVVPSFVLGYFSLYPTKLSYSLA